MLKKLLIPLAALSTIIGVSTSVVAGTTMLQTPKPTVHENAIQLPKETISDKATPTATATPSITATPIAVAPPAEKYNYKGDGAPGVLAVELKTHNKFTTYNSDANKLRTVGKCVVSFYAPAVSGVYDATQQKVTSEKLIEQYASTLKLKNVKAQEGTLLSNESYGTGKINYKVDAAYSKFTAKAVHGTVYARMFNDGLGFMLSVTCPTKTKVPSATSIIRLKTDYGIVQPPKYYPDDHRLAF